jgi:YD repeat-containing protein
MARRRKKTKRDRGEGSVDHRGGTSWRLRYRTAGRRISVTVEAADKDTAIVELRKRLQSLDDKTHVAPSKVTFQQWATEWLGIGAPGGRKRKVCTERTIDRYRDILQTHVYPVLGALRLQALQPTDIDRLSVGVRNKVSNRTNRKLAKTTQHHIFAVTQAALNAAVRRGLLVVNPCGKADVVPEADPKPGIALDENELAKLVAGFRAEGTYLAPIVALAAATGCRRNELLALVWEDVDFAKQTLRIERAWEPTRVNGLKLKPPKSRRGLRVIDLDLATIEMLRQHRVTYMRMVAGIATDADVDLLVKLPKNSLLFPAPPWGDRGLDFRRPRPPTKVSNDFREIATKLGQPDFWLHHLRTTHSTLLLDRGVPLHRVAARIGDTPEVLLKSYAKLTKKKSGTMQDALNVLGTYIQS